MTLALQDLYPGHDATGYCATNEEPAVHTMLLERRSIKRVGCIASGGEIPLLVFLPKKAEVVAIDHSYRSLAMTWGKTEALKRLGSKKTKNLLMSGSKREIGTFFESLVGDAPEKLHSGLRSIAAADVYNASYSDLRREWFYADLSLIEVARRNLNKLSLVHGDFTDLAQFNKFDCLYISNALEHVGRDGRQLNWNILRDLLKPNGLVVLTRGSAYTPFSPKPGWECVKTINGYRNYVWNYVLVRKVKMPDPPKPTIIAPYGVTSTGTVTASTGYYGSLA